MMKIITGLFTVTMLSLVAIQYSHATADAGKIYTPSEIKKAFEADQATLKGKDAAVSGEVNSVQPAGTKYYLSLRDVGTSGYDVYCEVTLAAGEKAPELKSFDKASVSGTVSGMFFKAVHLKPCQMKK